MVIKDMTETNAVQLRKTIYLTIMSSLDFEECAHKLLKMTIREGQEVSSKPNQCSRETLVSPSCQAELCNMIIDCCSQERSYLKFYGLLAGRFCELKREYQEEFANCFVEQVVCLVC